MVCKLPSLATAKTRKQSPCGKHSNCATKNHHQLSDFPHKEPKDNNLQAQTNLRLYKHVRSIKRH